MKDALTNWAIVHPCVTALIVVGFFAFVVAYRCSR